MPARTATPPTLAPPGPRPGPAARFLAGGHAGGHLTRGRLLAVAALLAAAFCIRLHSAVCYWDWFDCQFPQTWSRSKIELSPDGSQYIQQADPGTWASPTFRNWQQRPYYRPPLPSYYFQWLFRATNFNRVTVAAVQSAMAVAAYLLIYLTVAGVLGHRVGLISLLVSALHPVLIFYDHSFEDSSLALLPLAAAVYLFLRWRNAHPAAMAPAGLLAGLAVLARVNLVLVLVGLAAMLLLASTRRRLLRACLFLAPAALVTLVPSWHNYRASGRFSFVAATAGENLFWGNNPNPHWRIMIQGQWYIPEIDRGSPMHLLLEKTLADAGVPLAQVKHTDIDPAFGAAAVRYLRENPGHALAGFLRKLARHVSNYEIPRNRNFHALRSSSPAFRLPLLPYSLLMAFAFLGCLSLRGARDLPAALLLPWFACLFAEVLFFNASRYRAVAIPFLVPLAVAGLGLLVDLLLARRPAPLAAAASLVAALFLTGHWAVPDRQKHQYLSASHFTAAMMEAYAQGPAKRLALLDQDRFVRRLEQALTEDPGNASAFHAMQKHLIRKGLFARVKTNMASFSHQPEAADWLAREVLARLDKEPSRALGTAPGGP